jgi:hypothetical protein
MQVHTTKDLVNLLQLLQTARQTGDLFVAPVEEDGPQWQGWLQLHDGRITASAVRNKSDGQVIMRNDEAVRWLINPRHGKLEWFVKEAARPASDLFLPVSPTQLGPTQLSPTQRNLNQLGPARYNPPQLGPMQGNLPSRSSTQKLPEYSREAQPGNSLYNNNNPYPSPASQTARLELVPRRTEKGRYVLGEALTSREQRQVFALIDGQRNVNAIIHLLHKTPELVLHILNELGAMGIIE